MEYGVFQIRDGILVYVDRFNSKEEAIDFVRTGVNYVILEIYN